MNLGTLKLAPGNRWTGTIEHHAQTIALTLEPIDKPTGPSHRLLVEGQPTEPESFAWMKPDRSLRARLTLNAGATTLYLVLTPASAGAYAVSWQRPTRSDQRAPTQEKA